MSKLVIEKVQVVFDAPEQLYIVKEIIDENVSEILGYFPDQRFAKRFEWIILHTDNRKMERKS